MKEELRALACRVNDTHGELDFRLRDNYFNLYYKGNSMAKVTVMGSGYRVAVHRKFSDEADDSDDVAACDVLGQRVADALLQQCGGALIEAAHEPS